MTPDAALQYALTTRVLGVSGGRLYMASQETYTLSAATLRYQCNCGPKTNISKHIQKLQKDSPFKPLIAKPGTGRDIRPKIVRPYGSTSINDTYVGPNVGIIHRTCCIGLFGALVYIKKSQP